MLAEEESDARGVRRASLAAASGAHWDQVRVPVARMDAGGRRKGRTKFPIAPRMPRYYHEERQHHLIISKVGRWACCVY